MSAPAANPPQQVSGLLTSLAARCRGAPATGGVRPTRQSTYSTSTRAGKKQARATTLAGIAEALVCIKTLDDDAPFVGQGDWLDVLRTAEIRRRLKEYQTLSDTLDTYAL